MSTIPHTAISGPAGLFRVPRKLVALVLVVALAAAALTIVLVASGSDSAAPPHAVNSAAPPHGAAQSGDQRLYLGGPREGAPGLRRGRP